MDTDTWVMLAVVGARALLPLAILRAPLPGILGCLVLDAVDRSIFSTFGSVPADYEAYDKAMDTYYLSFAYLSVLRNWTDLAAVRIAQVLFAVRMVGVVAFELVPWSPLLLIFPNAFEYFFIVHEAVRTRWSVARVGAREWVLVATVIWVAIKLPQEWWIHVAHLDATSFAGDHPWWSLLVLLTLSTAAVTGWLLRSRLVPSTDHRWRVLEGGLPDHLGDPQEEAEWKARHRGVVARVALEKVLLVTGLVVVFGHVVPGTDVTELQLLAGTTVLVVANSAATLVAGRRRWAPSSVRLAFFWRLTINAVLLGLLELVALPTDAELDAGHASIFLALLTVISAGHERYRPVLAFRERREPQPATH